MNKFFAMLVLLVVLAGLWFSFSGLFEIYRGASDTIKAASIAAFGSVAIFLLGRYFEQRREAKLRINSEKIEIYKAFYQFYFDIMSYEKIHGKPKSSNDVMREMLDF
ncbi:MAG: hypothetical protein JXQ85_14680 [Cognatishimia sp.]|uniref:hypothetical protein n=1 Tax=Cognatishimia sp. TaxID=2211648 RepID=UPI003B8BF438